MKYPFTAKDPKQFVIAWFSALVLALLVANMWPGVALTGSLILLTMQVLVIFGKG